MNKKLVVGGGLLIVIVLIFSFVLMKGTGVKNLSFNNIGLSFLGISPVDEPELVDKPELACGEERHENVVAKKGLIKGKGGRWSPFGYDNRTQEQAEKGLLEEVKQDCMENLGRRLGPWDPTARSGFGENTFSCDKSELQCRAGGGVGCTPYIKSDIGGSERYGKRSQKNISFDCKTEVSKSKNGSTVTINCTCEVARDTPVNVIYGCEACVKEVETREAGTIDAD